MTAIRRPISDAVIGRVVNTASAVDGALMIVDASNDNAVVQSATSSPTAVQETFVGLLKTNAGFLTTSGQSYDIVEEGEYAAVAGGTITRGNYCTSNGDGTLIALNTAPGGGVKVGVIGIAMQSAVATQRFTLKIQKFIYTG